MPPVSLSSSSSAITGRVSVTLTASLTRSSTTDFQQPPMRENHLSATMPYAHMGASTVAHTSPPMSAQSTCVTSLVLITKSAEVIADIVLLMIGDEPL